MRAEISFGRSGLDLELPEGFQYRFLEARSAQALPDASEAICGALDAPIGTAPLEALARGKKTAAISVCDITRPVPYRRMLPPMLERLHRGGIQPEGVTFLIATGLHREATAEEVSEILGPEIASRYRWANHNARDLSSHRYLGATAGGTPVYIDQRFVSADLRLTSGLIEPHMMLGFSGGRKLVVPGQAARETILVLHSPKFMRDPRAVKGSIADNPLHKEFLEIAGMAGQDFVLDVALNRDREIAGVFAGAPAEAHRKGTDFVSQVMLEVIDEPVDAAITTGAGYPLDLTFYQSVKGIIAAAPILKPKGKVLLFGACEEGPGAPEFREMLKTFPCKDEFMRRIEKAPVVIDQWQLEKLALAMGEAEVFFYVPGLPAEYYPTLWGKVFQKPAEAVAAFTRALTPGSVIAVIPEGPYVLAKCRSAAATSLG